LSLRFPLAFFVVCLGVPAFAQEDAGVPLETVATADAGSKFEWAIFPVLAGSTDIGFEFGAFAVVTKLAPKGSKLPYEWALQGQLAMSVNGKPGGGVELPVHDDNVSFDWRSLDGQWRFAAQLWFWHAANAGFYGIGNTTLATGDPRATSVRSTQYIRSEIVAEADVGWQVLPYLRFRGGLAGRRLAPQTYVDSTLSLSAAEEPLVLGVNTNYSLIGTVGVELDTRDNELAPNRGVYVAASLRGSAGALTGNDLSWGGTNLHVRGYYDVWPGRVVLGARALLDTVFDRPPTQEFSRSGGFEAVWMLGGSGGVRGIPEGRYQGRIRLTMNAEARVYLFGFDLFDTHFSIGLVGFVDAGRVWADWKPRPDLDGTGVGLHVTYGGGLRLRIGDTIMIRFDLAWAPPPITTPDDQVGFYADLGNVF
jgi:hypothetical protein